MRLFWWRKKTEKDDRRAALKAMKSIRSHQRKSGMSRNTGSGGYDTGGEGSTTAGNL